MGEQRTDEELVHGVRTGPRDDLRPFELLVERHKQHVMTNCRYMTRSEDAEDLAQEVFVKAYFALDRFEGRASFKTWLRRIKVNHCLQYIKKRRGRTLVDIDEPGLIADPRVQVAPKVEKHLEAAEQRRLISESVEALPETLRVPLVMREIDELSYEEIADSLGIGSSAAKMRIKRGRETFRQLYAELEARLPESSESRT